MPEVKLDITDAAELTEMLQLLSQWLARDPARLGASLEEFVGHPAYGISQLRGDLDRCVFLLGGSDGEPLCGHDQGFSGPGRDAPLNDRFAVVPSMC